MSIIILLLSNGGERERETDRQREGGIIKGKVENLGGRSIYILQGRHALSYTADMEYAEILYLLD